MMMPPRMALPDQPNCMMLSTLFQRAREPCRHGQGFSRWQGMVSKSQHIPPSQGLTRWWWCQLQMQYSATGLDSWTTGFVARAL